MVCAWRVRLWVHEDRDRLLHAGLWWSTSGYGVGAVLILAEVSAGEVDHMAASSADELSSELALCSALCHAMLCHAVLCCAG